MIFFSSETILLFLIFTNISTPHTMTIKFCNFISVLSGYITTAVIALQFALR